MAGTLTISTLSDGTNSTSSTNCIQGSAKAWVNFNGVPATPTIRASYNISSVTKTGTGQYTCTFLVAMIDANYAATTGCADNYNSTIPGVVFPTGSGGFAGALTNYSSTAFGVGQSAADHTLINVAVFR